MLWPKKSTIFAFCLIFFLLSSSLEGEIPQSGTGNTVALVRGTPITWFQLQNRYELLWRDYQNNPEEYPEVSAENFQQDLKRISLEQLIKERLYQIYAQEHNIVVTEEEVKESLEEIYAGNQLFFTNGIFDERKFAEFKSLYPERYKKISQTIRNDLLNTKIERIVKNQFNPTDSQLSEIYFMENAKLKLEYIVIPDSIMPDMFPSTPAYLNQFYEFHKNDYINPEKVKIRSFFVPDSDFYPIAEDAGEGLHPDAYQVDGVDQTTAHGRAYLYAKELIRKLNSGEEKISTLEKEYYLFETEFLKRGDTIGGLKNSKNIVKFAYWLQPGEFFPYPIEQDKGWVVFQTIDRGRKSSSFLKEDPRTVWIDYIHSARDLYFDYAVEDYFENYIKDEDILRVNISYVKFNGNLLQFPISISPDSIKRYYEENIEEFVTVRDTLPLEKVSYEIEEILYKEKYEELKNSFIDEAYNSVRQNNFQLDIPGANIVQNVTFIKNMPYYGSPFSLLKDKIFVTPPDSAFIVRNTPDIIIGRVNSKNRFRSGELMSLKPLIEVLLTESWDKQWYRRFYEFHDANKDSYRTPDTLQLRCCFIPVDTTDTNIPMSEVFDYFCTHRIQYTRPYSVKLETIFLENSPHLESQIQTIQKAISPPYNTDFSLLAQLFFTPSELTLKNGEIINFSQLDESIQTVLDTMRVAGVSSPIFVSNGCYIIKLLEKNEERVPDFQEVAHEVISDLKFQFADSIAQNTAFTIFNSVSSISQLQAIEDSIHTFRTSYIALESDQRTLFLTNQEDPQAPIFTLTLSEDEYSLLSRTRRGSIIPKIFSLPDSNPAGYHLKNSHRQGYLILFVENKILGERLSGYESYAHAREDFSRIIQYEASREFTAYLRDEVKKSGKNIILTKIFGGLKDTGWLSLYDAAKESSVLELVIQDAVQRELGTYSHPIRLTDYGFGYYHIVDKKIPSRKDFLEEKGRFREEYINAQFNKWFENYKKQNRVEILIEL
jgi:hypothetical protein